MYNFDDNPYRLAWYLVWFLLFIGFIWIFYIYYLVCTQDPALVTMTVGDKTTVVQIID